MAQSTVRFILTRNETVSKGILVLDQGLKGFLPVAPHWIVGSSVTGAGDWTLLFLWASNGPAAARRHLLLFVWDDG